MHPAIEAIRDATIGTPFEGKVWLVGGAVRDELLCKPHLNDFDLVTTETASDLAQLLYQKGVSQIFPVEYPRFGTAMVRVQNTPIELVTARRESYTEASRKPTVEPATLLEDAQRRDFTVNALERNIYTGELHDPVGCGLQDLKDKILRTPLDPKATFYDDPLRMLRAVRFRWQLGFEPAPGLYESIKEEAERLKIISAERIRDEFTKMLCLNTAPECMQDLLDLNLIHQFAPEFESTVGFEQGNFHHLDVWGHTLLVLKNAGPGDLELSLASLLHDIAKPNTMTVDENGRIRFFTHEVVGADMARDILKRLRFPSDEIESVAKLIRNHMRLGSSKVFSASAARRLVRDMGDQLETFLQLVQADRDAHKPGFIELDLDAIRARIEEISLTTPRETLESPLSGNEIIQITGLPPGKKVGLIKQMLVEHVLDGTLNPDDKETAARLVKEAGI